MPKFNVVMEVTVSIEVEADTESHARLIALGSLQRDQSEFDRRIVNVEDVTPAVQKVRKGRGSY